MTALDALQRARGWVAQGAMRCLPGSGELLSDLDAAIAEEGASPPTRVKAAADALRALTDDQRVEVMAEFCHGCGREHCNGQCMNDE